MQTPRELLERVASESAHRNRDLSFRELGVIVYLLYDHLAPDLIEAKLTTADRAMASVAAYTTPLMHDI